jgi:hypothetical protein
MAITFCVRICSYGTCTVIMFDKPIKKGSCDVYETKETIQSIRCSAGRTPCTSARCMWRRYGDTRRDDWGGKPHARGDGDGNTQRHGRGTSGDPARECIPDRSDGPRSNIVGQRGADRESRLRLSRRRGSRKPDSTQAGDRLDAATTASATPSAWRRASPSTTARP